MYVYMYLQKVFLGAYSISKFLTVKSIKSGGTSYHLIKCVVLKFYNTVNAVFAVYEQNNGISVNKHTKTSKALLTPSFT